VNPLILEKTVLNGGAALEVRIDGFGKRIVKAWEIHNGPVSWPLPKISKAGFVGRGKTLLVHFTDKTSAVISPELFFPPIKIDAVVINIGELLTFANKTGISLKKNWAFTVGQGKIIEAGPQEQTLNTIESGLDVVVIDAGGATVSPGLIDSHTHPVFAGNRAGEFAMRARGANYQDILKAGGGILNSASKTREAWEDGLIEETISRLKRSISFGVTAIEAKSGYALNLEGELKSLRVIKAASSTLPLDISPTLLAAHVIPSEFKQNRQGYVDLIINEILPKAKIENLLRSCDVFCEESAFSLDETRNILMAAKKLGLDTRIHAGQFTSLGAVKLGAEIGSLSVDHLEEVSEEEMDALANSSTVATLLPGAAMTLNMKPPSGRRFIERGIDVALATDMNPGTSMTQNLPLMASLGSMQMEMSVEEVWRGITINGAKAAGFSNMGYIAPGAQADFVIWDFSDYSVLPYHYGINPASRIFKKGREIIL
jgi:imidazolonepropionase